MVEEEGDEYENDEYICDEEDDVPAPTMWTKKEIQDFKSAIKSEGGDSVLSVSQTVSSVYLLHLFIFALQSTLGFETLDKAAALDLATATPLTDLCQ